MQAEMMNLFAVPVAKSSIDRVFSEEELQFFQKELQNPRKAIGNYSSGNKNVLDAEAMQPLRALIQQALDNYFKAVYNTSNKVSLQITQSWLTLSRQGESHHSHTHPNSIVSGVLYINLAEQDGISFYRNEDNLWYELIPKEQNYYNSYSMFVETRIGDIVLFPSSVSHGVPEVTSKVERVSLAFNTFFTGELGNPEFSNALNISSR